MVAKVFEFPKLSLMVYGESESMNDLYNYFTLHSHTHIYIESILNRIYNNNLHIHANGKTIFGKIDAYKFNKLFKRIGVYATSDDFISALFLSNPDEMSKILNITNENKKYLLDLIQNTKS